MIKTIFRVDMKALEFKIRRIFIHPDFIILDNGLPMHDLALVQTKAPMALNKSNYARPLRLCNPKEVSTTTVDFKRLLGFCGLGSIATDETILAIPSYLQEILFTQDSYKICPDSLICVTPQTKKG